MNKLCGIFCFNQETKQMDHQINQTRVLNQGTNDQAQIILHWTHYAKTQLSGEGSNTGKGGRKEKMMISNKGSLSEDLRNQIIDRLSWRKSMWSLRVNTNLIAYIHYHEMCIVSQGNTI